MRRVQRTQSDLRPFHALAVAAVIAGSAPGTQAQWVAAHAEDFQSGAPLDARFWTTETGFQRNHEAQYYTAANITSRTGALVIEARREAKSNAAFRAGSRDWRYSSPTASYTSGSLVSREAFQYARIEIVARSPTGLGVWPAMWLLNDAGGEYGEIDLFEAVGKHPDTVFGVVHYGRTAGTREYKSGQRVIAGFDGNWHTHTLEWTPERIAMAVDKLPVFEFDPRRAQEGGLDPLRRPMRLHINLALGGSWGGAIDDSKLPARLEIASVRIWRWQPDAPVEASAGAAGAAGAIGDPPPRWGR